MLRIKSKKLHISEGTFDIGENLESYAEVNK